MGRLVMITMWLACGIFAAGLSNAHLRADTPRLHESPEKARETLAFSLVWGIAGGPVALATVTVINTLSHTDPWTLTSKPFPCVETYRDIWCGSAA